MHIPFSATAVLAASLCLLLLSIAPVSADPDPIIQTCYNTGCSTVVSLLAPCGGGATNSSLQQDLIYTPTASLGGCECNYYFYNSFSSCLACIASQGESSPEIQNQQDWVSECASYGFNYTNTPVTNSTSSGNNSSDGSGGGMSSGAIIGIVIGVVALLALAGALFFVRGRKSKSENEKTELFDQPTSPTSDGGATAAAAALSASYNNADYPATYDNQGDYYTNQQTDYNDQFQNQAYAHHGDYNQQYATPDYQNNGYYDANVHNDAMMMQNINQNNGYVLPPPNPPSVTPEAAAAVAAAAYAAVPRPSESFPQSLRNKPKGWDTDHQQEPLSGLVSTDNALHVDKTEFDDGEDLELPQSRNRFASDDDFTTRRSMTPPRANMQSYRDEYNRPSFEREPRLSNSDRGSTSGLNTARGLDSSINNLADYDQQGDFVRGGQDSPESSRRRARAAELFSAEGRR